MIVKKKRSSKVVSIALDADSRRKLAAAVNALSECAAATATASNTGVSGVTR